MAINLNNLHYFHIRRIKIDYINVICSQHAPSHLLRINCAPIQIEAYEDCRWLCCCCCCCFPQKTWSYYDFFPGEGFFSTILYHQPRNWKYNAVSNINRLFGWPEMCTLHNWSKKNAFTLIVLFSSIFVLFCFSLHRIPSARGAEKASRCIDWHSSWHITLLILSAIVLAFYF